MDLGRIYIYIYISLFVQIKCTYNKVEHEVMLVQKSNI